MTVTSAVGAVRERWLTILVGVLVGLVVAAAVSALIPATYVAKSSVYVTETPGARTAPGTVPSMFFVERLASYPQVIVSDQVLGPAADRLGRPGEAKALAGSVTVSSTPGSAVLTVTATGAESETTAAVANAVAQSFVETLAVVERTPGSPAPPAVSAIVTDGASPSTVPDRPRTGANLVLGGTVGLIAACAWILLHVMLNTTVRSPADLRSIVGGVTLGVLPRAARWARRVRTAQDDGFDGAVRRMRSRLFLVAPDDPPRVLVFCAATPGDGTTTVVRALAGTLAPTSSRVLLVDADLRRPALAEWLELDARVGFSEVLAHRTSPDEAVQHVAGVDVLVAGTTPSDPEALLSSPRAAEVFEQLRARYDRILVDAPAVVPVLDAALLARHADAAVLVARDGVTTAAALETAVEALAETDTPLLGSVLTGAMSLGDMGGDRRSARPARRGQLGSWCGPSEALESASVAAGARPRDSLTGITDDRGSPSGSGRAGRA